MTCEVSFSVTPAELFACIICIFSNARIAGAEAVGGEDGDHLDGAADQCRMVSGPVRPHLKFCLKLGAAIVMIETELKKSVRAN